VFTLTRICAFFAALAMHGALSAARADYISQSVTLDQSNTLKDGLAYGSVLIEAYDGVGSGGGGLKAGEVRLTYAANPGADYASLSKTFGIDHVGFNTDLAILADQINPPSGWKISNRKSLASFGKFTWNADGSAKGGTRPNPVTLVIGGLGKDATVGHFLIGSDGPEKGPPTEDSVYFAMHVAGFTANANPNIGSHWVGGSGVDLDLPPPPEGAGELQPTPEPTGFLLAAFGAGCVWFGRWWRFRRE